MGWLVNATPRPLYPRERPGTHCIEGWVGPRSGLGGCGKPRPHRDSIPASPARSASPYRLSYPGPPVYINIFVRLEISNPSCSCKRSSLFLRSASWCLYSISARRCKWFCLEWVYHSFIYIYGFTTNNADEKPKINNDCWQIGKPI
jgi:hypothetical protein